MVSEYGMLIGLFATLLAGVVGFFVVKKNIKNQLFFSIVVSLISIFWISFIQLSGVKGDFLFGTKDTLQVGFLSGNPLSIIMFFVLTPVVFLLMVLRGFKSDVTDDQSVSVIGFLWGFAGLWCALFGATVWTVLGAFPILFLSNAILSRSDVSYGVTSNELFKDSFQRIAAWLLLVSGVGILAGVGLPSGWSPVTLNGYNSSDISVGLIVVFLGSVFSFKVFPFVPVIWTSSSSRVSLRRSWSRFWFPASISLLFLIRFSKLFEASGFGGVFSIISMLVAILMFLSSLSQSTYEKTRDGMQSGFFMLSLSILLNVGELAGLASWIGFVFGNLALDIIHTTSENSKSGLGVIGKSLAGLMLMGAPGFVGFPSMISWYSNSLDRDFGILSLKISTILFFLVTAWKLVFMPIQTRSKEVSSTDSGLELALVVPFLLLFGLSLIWWGDFIGYLFGPSENVWTGFFRFWSDSHPSLSFLAPSEPFTSTIIHLGSLVVSALISYWFVLARPEVIRSLVQKWPRFLGFIQHGYGAPVLDRSLELFFQELSLIDQAVLEKKVWNQVVPAVAIKVLDGSSYWIKEFDYKVSYWIRTSVSKTAQSFIRITQLVQSGDFQWYLVFGIMAGIVMILHILRG